ncbi:hypothetical protein HDU97_007002 [Phlyctochytrium planicorne]|nr:hypothetical protein HDU97_007002 [Phlyctochytrium planicorne]
MQIRHLKTICPAADAISRVTAVAWSPNNQKLAVVGVDKVISLFDETGERKDRFSTKPGDPKSTKPYYVCALAFSPDSTRLAVAQTDCVVFVYKLGLEWGEKKSICNKLIHSAEITCLTWPKEQQNALVFGMNDGKVRIGNLKTNKAATLYQTDSCVVSAASSLDGNAIITGHLDGSINRFFFDDGISGASQGKFAVHSCAPTALSWGESIIAAGSDRQVAFYDNEGRIINEFDYSKDEEEQELSLAEFSPSGQSAAIGGFSRLHIYNYSAARQIWEEAPMKTIENFYSVTAMSWKPDGSRLIAANICGAVEMFDCCLRRSRYKGKFEFTYVSPSQVIVKRLSTGSRIVLKSHYGYEIEKVNIFQDQFLIANTPDTLLIGDLSSCKLSEIPWTGSGEEKFYFDNPQVCMVFNAGELSLVEYGVNEILGSCRTEHMNPHLISVRLNERKSDEDIKRIAYLIDLQTVHILDLISGLNVGVISHDAKIDWLEGEIEDIEREKGKTEVIVDEGVNTVSYTLDEGLIEFGTALDDKDYERAVMLLETLEMTPETEAMWKTLSSMALKDRKISIAQRCFAALGDICRSRFLQSLLDFMESSGLDERVKKIFHVHADDLQDGINHYSIRAKLAVLDKQFKVAESIYLEQGKVEEAMEMYQEMHKWNLSIKVAEVRNHPELDHLRRNYFQWLIDSGQEDKAGELKEEEGDIIAAINLFLKGGMPARAAFLLNHHNHHNIELTERVAAALFKSSLYEKAGDLFEKLGSNERALDAYRRGKAFRAAVELSRVFYPQEIISLEELKQWGDHLVSQKQMDAAINHYIEAGKSFKAIEAAIGAKQWKKAVGILDCLQPPESGKPYFLELAKHFASVSDFALAEKYFVQAGKPQEAVDMYTRNNKWEKAHALATTYMSPEEVAFLYISQAREMEAQGKLKEAEKLYLTVGEPDLAINMYKNHKHYDQMIRLVTAYHKDLLIETHLYLGKTLETEGNFKLAEHHYVEGKDWKAAINMYCANSAYEDAYRIAKSFGGPNSAKQVAYLWARSLGGESAVKLLTKFGLLEAAIDFATENGAFDFAFELSRFADKFKLSDVHYKHAMYLEDNGKFKEAENAFILAGKPKEAILMYIHNENWEAAFSVAETYDPNSVGEVLIGQAKISFDRKEYGSAETLLLRAQRPDLAIKLYKDAGMWKEAIRFAKEYLPNKLSEVHEDYDRFLAGQSNSNRKDELLSTAKLLEQQKDYNRAIDMYLKFNTPQVTDLNFLEEVWEKAVALSMKFVPDRGHEVVTTVCTRLMSVKRFDQAGELFSSAEMFKESIDAYISGGSWDKAKEITRIAPKYADYVESHYVSHLKSKGHADALVAVDIAAGLDLFAQRGDWDKCLETAANQGADFLHKYLLSFTRAMMKEGKFDNAVQQIAKYGAPITPSSQDMYLHLSREVLHYGSPTSLTALREMLFKMVTANSSPAPPEFHRRLLIAHLLTLRNFCGKKRELMYFASKISISLLRYCKEIGPDRAFYEAGQFAKLAGMTNMAFVCWNRYLDISDAIEEGDASMLENSDFENTDVPYDIDLPAENMKEAKRDEVRDWVLQVSLDQKVKQEIDRRDCEECGTKIYDASLSCYNCKTTNEPCIITGYPLLRNRVRCSSCACFANKDDWNKFTMMERVCPWCGTPQQPVFM